MSRIRPARTVAATLLGGVVGMVVFGAVLLPVLALLGRSFATRGTDGHDAA